MKHNFTEFPNLERLIFTFRVFYVSNGLPWIIIVGAIFYSISQFMRRPDLLAIFAAIYFIFISLIILGVVFFVVVILESLLTPIKQEYKASHYRISVGVLLILTLNLIIFGTQALSNVPNTVLDFLFLVLFVTGFSSGVYILYLLNTDVANEFLLKRKIRETPYMIYQKFWIMML